MHGRLPPRPWTERERRDTRGRLRYHRAMGPSDPPREADASGLDETIRLLAHQLKSPINAIRSLLDAVAQAFPGDVPPQAAHLVERASRRADEARELVSDLLAYETLAGRAELGRDEIDLAALASEAAAGANVAAADKGISVETDFPEGVAAWVRGDSRSLGQALRNLVENAIKYTPEGGSVTVSVRTLDDRSRVAVAVADTGTGIPAEELPRLFEPFFRSSRHRATMPGTGLGLAISRRIVEAHGGTLGAESREGAGSTFTIALPLLRVEVRTTPSRKRRRVVIVGGVTAGPKTAARLRRLDADAEIIMIEKSEFLSYTGCGLPGYVGGRVESPRALMSTADNSLRTVRFFAATKDVRVLNRTLASEVDRAGRAVHCTDLTSGRRFSVPYDVLVLATGAQPVVPPVPGVDLEGIYTLYSLEAARELRTRLHSRGSLDAFIVGAGFIGVSMAESLVEAGARVTMLERDPVIMRHYFDADVAGRVQEELERRGVKVLTSRTLTRFDRLRDGLRLETEDATHPADLVILATGVAPNVDLARRSGLEIGPSGGIRVNARLQTSDESIYAVGDCAETVNLVSGRSEFLPLGSVSTKMGRVAADAIAGRDVSFPGCLGTAMLRVFDLNVARTGLTHARALERGFDAVSVTVAGLDRPHYEARAARVRLKVTADRRTGKLLGAQGTGAGDVVHRVQILASAISAGLTLEEVFGLDLGYSPVFTTAIDLAQTACLLLRSIIDGLLRTITPEELRAARPAPRIVDVSPYAEYARRAIPGSVNVPLENLRTEGIPYGQAEQIVLCDGVSSGAYEAYRILVSRGWTGLSVLEGGTEEWGDRGTRGDTPA
jgi:NADPH-dependent 2,4-dienoyl-CoA reductase/sulfur reductase-like enzyme/rhodanese-related sulfurtransferase/two-component sensor histidine kinase